MNLNEPIYLKNVIFVVLYVAHNVAQFFWGSCLTFGNIGLKSNPPVRTINEERRLSCKRVITL